MRGLVVFLLVVGLASATQARAANAGFVDVTRLVATHPLHGVLAQYDREIAALRDTQKVVGLGNPELSATNAATSLQADAATAAARAEAIGRRNASADLARERQGIAAMLRFQQVADRERAASSMQLIAETNANLQAYRGGIAERTQRAYAARQQQLHENESTLAYNLARRDAGKRLVLRLKIDDLHLSAEKRARLQALLIQVNLSELNAVDELRRSDARELEAYRAQLERAGSAWAATMDAQLRTKSEANYAILQRVFNEETGASTFPLLSQVEAFSKTYAPSSTARSIATGMQSSARDVAQRFEGAAADDAQSKRDVAAQLASLQAHRAALYRSIMAEITAATQLVARERHVSSIRFVANREKGGGLDLTGPVELRLAQKW
jgi:hypothetical protein